jgi:hypothetical protein
MVRAIKAIGTLCQLQSLLNTATIIIMGGYVTFSLRKAIALPIRHALRLRHP